MIYNDLGLGEYMVLDPSQMNQIPVSLVKNHGKGPFKVVGLKSIEPINSDMAPYFVSIAVGGGTIHCNGEWMKRVGSDQQNAES